MYFIPIFIPIHIAHKLPIEQASLSGLKSKVNYGIIATVKYLPNNNIKVMRTMRKFTLLLLSLLIVFSSACPYQVMAESPDSNTEQGLSVEYQVFISVQPQQFKVNAVYRNVSGSLRLELGFMGYNTSLDAIAGLNITAADGKKLEYKKIDNRTLEVAGAADTITASYEIDMNILNHERGTSIAAWGAKFTGYDVFLMPSGQAVSSAKVKIDVPGPWQIATIYPQDGDWFQITPLNYRNLALEIGVSDWDIGEFAFDKTYSYNDGFKVRTVGMKNYTFRHWKAYYDNTAAEEAKNSADMFHKTWLEYRKMFGDDYMPKSMLLVGPDYWQGGYTWLRQRIDGSFMFQSTPHHMMHYCFGPTYPARINFNGAFFDIFREGYSIYSEGFLTAEITGNPMWEGMEYEKKIHYLRGLKYGNLEQNSAGYVTGFLTVLMIDDKIKRDTNGQKTINDFMSHIWKTYSAPDPVFIEPETMLNELKALTGTDWTEFYNQYILRYDKLDPNLLDSQRKDFELFLQYISGYWYSGHNSAYFINQELVSASDDFGFGTSVYTPINYNDNFINFIYKARKSKDLSKGDLTEQEIISLLNETTGKDHSDFFTFYRGLGFDVTAADISDFLRSYVYRTEHSDNIIKMTPSKVELGKSTPVQVEITDPEAAKCKEIKLQLNVYDLPGGLTDISKLVTGKGVKYEWSIIADLQKDIRGSQVIITLPVLHSGSKTYTEFTLNMPLDAGFIEYSFHLTVSEGIYQSMYGNFDSSLKKVKFPDTLTMFVWKPDIRRNKSMADDLKTAGIVRGDNNGIDLTSRVNRVQAAIVLVRLLGKEKEALEQANKHPFKDVPEWADSYIGYLYKNQLTNGISADLFGADQPATANQFYTFMLRALGYSDIKGDFLYTGALSTACSKGIIMEDNVQWLKDRPFFYDDMVFASYMILNASMKGTDTKLAAYLCNMGAMTENNMKLILRED